MSIKKSIRMVSKQLGELLQYHQWRCAVAESCTGGLLAAAITDIPGSSRWFDRGFITYTNASKIEMLGISPLVLSTYGAVSKETVCAMAEGAREQAKVDLSVAVSGIAGPSGGSQEKPVGTIWIAWAVGKRPAHAACYLFKGTRESIRWQSVCAALKGLLHDCTNEKE